MRAVDTNILVRFITRDDEDQAQRARAIIANGDLWIAKTVLLETEWVLRSGYKYTPQAMHDAFIELLGLPGVEVEDTTEVSLALRLFGEGVDFADAMHLCSRPEGADFITFDEALVRRARRAAIGAISQA